MYVQARLVVPEPLVSSSNILEIETQILDVELSILKPAHNT